MFRTTFSASQVPTPLAKFTYDKLKARTATVIAGDTVGTIELVMGFARAFEEAGGKVVQELYAPIGTTDFGPFIGRMRRDVDIVAALVAGADGIRFIKQYEEFGLKGKIQVVDTAPGITDISLLPSSGPQRWGCMRRNRTSTPLTTPNQKFVQAFRAKYGRDPGGPGKLLTWRSPPSTRPSRLPVETSRIRPSSWKRSVAWTWKHPAGVSGSTSIKTSLRM